MIIVGVLRKKIANFADGKVLNSASDHVSYN